MKLELEEHGFLMNRNNYTNVILNVMIQSFVYDMDFLKLF